ncbi:MAG: GNAT family N-acetyltransferase [Sphingobacterium sp.]
MKSYKLDQQHIQERCDWLNHPKVFRHMNMQYPITLLETQKWFERAVLNSSRIDFAFEEDDDIVAMTGLTNVDTVNGIVEFYIMVNPNLQGKGYGMKTTEYTLNYAFLNYNIHKIYLYTNSFNERANNLYLKLGFQLEGTLRMHKFKNGEMVDRCIYGLLKDDWVKMAYAHKEINLEF